MNFPYPAKKSPAISGGFFLREEFFHQRATTILITSFSPPIITLIR